MSFECSTTQVKTHHSNAQRAPGTQNSATVRRKRRQIKNDITGASTRNAAQIDTSPPPSVSISANANPTEAQLLEPVTSSGKRVLPVPRSAPACTNSTAQNGCVNASTRSPGTPASITAASLVNR